MVAFLSIVTVFIYLHYVTYSYQAGASITPEADTFFDSNFSVHSKDVPVLRGDTIDRAASLQIQLTDGVRMLNKHRKLLEGCRVLDIEITQEEISGVGMPRFYVQIANLCSDHHCVIRNTVVYCPSFHSYYFVDPNVFKVLDHSEGTCIVNNGQGISSGSTLGFVYGTIYMQQFRLKSAQVFCTQV